MAQIPIFKSGIQAVDLWQSRAKSLIDPILGNKITNGVLISSQSLTAGSNAISHTLNRQPLGWFLVDQTGPAIIWRTAWNSSTLTLTSSAVATITASFWIF